MMAARLVLVKCIGLLFFFLEDLFPPFGSGPGGSDQKVTVEQMIKAATINGAYLNYAEDTYGTVEKGKSADLIVLDQDITKIEPQKIGAVKVQKTLLKGKTIYEAK